MANSAVVGTLRAVLSADTAEFATAMEKAGDAADQTAAAMIKASGGFKELEVRASSITRLMRDFSGSFEARQAKEWAVAIEALGGAANLSEKELRQASAVFSDYTSKATAMGEKMGKIPPEIRKVASEVENLRSATSKSTGIVDQMRGAFSNLGPSVLASAAGFATALISVEGLQAGFRMLTSFVGDSVKAFLNAEVASKKIDASLRTQGSFTPKLAADYRALAEEMQNLTVNSDDLNAEAIAVFTSIGDIGPDSMKKALTAAADLSAGMGIGLVEAATKMARAIDGQENSLKRYSIEVENTSDKGERLDRVLQGVAKNFGGRAAAEVETTAGQIQQLGNAWDNVMEIIGGSIATSPAFIAFLQKTNDLLRQQAGEVDKVTEAYQRYQIEAAFRGFGMKGVDINLPEPKPLVDYTKALADARKELKEKLGPAQREQIEAAIALKQPLEELRQRFNLSAAAMAVLTGKTKENKKAVDESAKAYQTWADEATGAKALRDLGELEKRFARLTKEGGLNAQALKAIAKEAHEFRQKGMILSDELHNVSKHLIDFNAGVVTSTIKVPVLSDALTVTGREINAMGKEFGDVNKMFFEFNKIVDTSGVKMSAFLSKLPGAVTRKDLIETQESILTFGEKASKAFLDVGDAFLDLGHAIGGSAGQMIATVGAISQGIGQLASGQYLQGIASLTAAVAKFAKGLTRNLARDVQDAFATTELGFANLNTLMARLKELGAVDLVNRGDRAQRKDDEKETRKWMEDVRKFLAEVDAKAATLFGRLATAVESFGGKAPAALQPLIQELLRINALTEEQRTLLEGMSGAPGWRELQAIAEKYGITLESLGQNFQDARLTDLAMQYARDFMTLRDAGADVSGVLEGMKDEVQELVLQSLKFGVALPEALRDVVNGLIGMGALVDENGNALTDLTRINFKGTLEDAFIDIKDILEEIRDLLAGGLPRAAASGAKGVEDEYKGAFGRIRNAVEPIRIPIEFDTGAFAPPEGFGLTPMQHGGIVRRATPALIGESGPEAVIPLDQLDSRPVIENRLFIDGREVTVSVVQHMRETARRLGVRPI